MDTKRRFIRILISLPGRGFIYSGSFGGIMDIPFAPLLYDIHLKNITAKEREMFILKYDKKISYVDSNVNILLDKLREPVPYK